MSANNKYICLIIYSLLLFNCLNAQQSNIKRPEDVFNNRPTAQSNDYKPPVNNRDSFNRENPDALFLGFFPAWSTVLLSIAVIFGFISICGFVGYLAGCRTPTKFIPRRKPRKVPVYFDDSHEDAAMKMMDQLEPDFERSFKNSKLTNYA